ncbi:hypothetical protein CALCODRAFT_493096 [Calocera cornea HHB12733]|uniref:BTB domain-containing protein n=1 Tax=Calocera cornea HHB12733 TaxID=1353952 RepID=A0A165HWQ8_9BASI|nr:hypothetical protein CALCODRAFT_493096 [Calocera cornea HHB12733]
MSETADQGDRIVFTPPASIKASPDIAIKSSDGDILHAHKAYLAMASSVFDHMFSLDGTSIAPSSEELPIIELSECTEILKALLSFIYPETSARLDSFKTFRQTLLAADKYELHGAVTSLHGYLTWPPFLKSNPLGVYAISSALKLDVERDNALKTLVTLEEKQLLTEDMDGIPAASIVEVLEARRVKRDVAMEAINRETWRLPRCEKCKAQPWWVSAWAHAVQRELREKPIIGRSFSYSSLEITRIEGPYCPCNDKHTWSPLHFQAFRDSIMDIWGDYDKHAC